MIEIATEKRWKEDFENKHKKKAGNGWFRYSTLGDATNCPVKESI